MHQNNVSAIRIHGDNVETGESFREHVQNDLHDKINRYWPNVTRANVSVKKDRHLWNVEIDIQLPHMKGFVAKDAKDELYAAYKSTAEKIDKQMRRLKRKEKDH